MSISAKLWVSAAAVTAVVIGLAAGSAQAIKPFKDAFEATYVKSDSKSPSDVALASAAKTAKCLICHMPESKKKRNLYGQQLGKLLDRKKDKDNTAKIRAALETVAALKANPADPQSPTFGELIHQGKLPGGTGK
jgi:hypothetical protein